MSEGIDDNWMSRRQDPALLQMGRVGRDGDRPIEKALRVVDVDRCGPGDARRIRELNNQIKRCGLREVGC